MAVNNNRNLLIKLDAFVDHYVPVVSSLTNLVHLCALGILKVSHLANRKWEVNNHYFKHIHENKSFTRCIVLMLPIVGNIIYNCIDRKMAKNEKQYQAGLRAETEIYNTKYFDPIRFYEKAAKHGHDKSAYKLSKIYSQGRISLKGKSVQIPKNDELGIKYLKQAAELGHPKAQLGWAWRMHPDNKDNDVTKNPIESFKWTHKSAEQGYWKAQRVLGHMLANGSGTKKNVSEALKWYRKAAENAVSMQFWLGLHLLDGSKLPKNSSEGIKWLRKAANQELIYNSNKHNNPVILARLFLSHYLKDQNEADKFFEQGKKDLQDSSSLVNYKQDGIAAAGIILDRLAKTEDLGEQWRKYLPKNAEVK